MIVRRASVLAAGFVPLDLIVTSREPISVRRAVGGTCGNVVIILRRLGLEATLLTAFGNDPRGELLRRELNAEGIVLADQDAVEGRRTGAVVELIGAGLRGKHRFTFRCPECHAALRYSNLAAPSRVRDYAERVSEFDVLFFDRPTAALLSLARAARQEGLLVVFEPNRLPAGSETEQAAALSDVVKYAVGSTSTARNDWVPPKGSATRLVVETLGGDGLRYKRRLRSDKWSAWKRMPQVCTATVADTAGAGDWCTAGIISVLGGQAADLPWRRTRIEEALAFGQALAAVSISFEGPRGVLRHATATSIRRLARKVVMERVVPERSVQRLAKGTTSDDECEYPEGCPLCLSPLASN